jgi:Xaa-Pro aminopeptidase
MMHDINPRVPFDTATRKQYLELPFPISEYEQRVDNTRRLLKERRLDGLIAFGDQNDFGYLTYLANFEPMFGRGAVVITNDTVSLITDSAFHGEPMHSLIWRTWVKKVTATGSSYSAFVAGLKAALTGVNRIGVIGTYSFPARELGLNVVDVEQPFLKMKSRKTSNELKVMKEASRITSCGMRAAIEATKIGVRENEIAAAACQAMFEEGASRLAFQPIIVAGPRAGTKHDYPSRRKIEDGDMVYLDLGAISDGYYSDMSRTMLIGRGNEKQRNALVSVLEIYNDLKPRIRPGVSADEVARAGERLAESKGWLEDFWPMGHGLGTGFLETPMFMPGSPDVFESGMVFAYEPMIVRLGLGTAVVEDTLALTESGVNSLTECERELW